MRNKIKYSDIEKKHIIDKLSNVAKSRYYSLSESDKKKFLKKAERFAEKYDFKNFAKRSDIKKRLKKINGKARVRGSIHNKLNIENTKNRAGSIRESYIMALNFLLLSTTNGDTEKEDANDESYLRFEEFVEGGRGFHSSLDHARAHIRKTFQSKNTSNNLRRTFVGNIDKSKPTDFSKSLVKRDVRKKAALNAKKSSRVGYQSTRHSVDSVKVFAENTKKVFKRIMESAKAMTSPIALIAGLVMVVFLALVCVLSAVIVSVSGGANDGDDASAYEAQVSEKTESYRGLVELYCSQYDIPDFVELALAMIEQESGGNPPDVMQTEQSPYNIAPPIDTAEESIICGTQELRDCLNAASCKGPNDINGIKLALQGYNFGNGYISWALKHYQGYTAENAKIFSQKMCASLNVSSYGDVEYVPHVLRYYVPIDKTSVSNQEAKDIIAELKENNDADNRAWKIIEEGASLIGKVEYSMDKRQGDGRDNPKYLDCSSFVAWAFHKCGYSGVPYSSTTATFIGSEQFKTIDAGDLKPGDIGLISSTAPTGGANHVGIYCGKLKNGTKVWLHCTSSSGTSLTGNDSGPMFGAYTGFGFFRRFKKFE